MKRRTIFLIIAIALVVAAPVFLINYFSNVKLTEAKMNPEKSLIAKNAKPEEIQAFRFLQNKLLSPKGIIYYLVDKKSTDPNSVSESMGQAMEYSALIGDAELFDQYAAITDKYFKDPSGYYYWRIDIASHKGETTSALVDDLRLAKAYFIAKENKLGNYDQKIEKLAAAIYYFDVNENGCPSDYYDGPSNTKADEVSLFYLDVETMDKLSKVNPKWLVPYNNSIKILLYIPENQFGFYPQTFKTDTKQYVWPPAINMVENLYTAFDVHKAGKCTRPFVNFLKAQIKQGKVYNSYNFDGTPASEDESTAVYALAARFLTLNDEREAAGWCYRRVLEFQIADKNSSEGGFGDSDTGLVYAFDQLEALLMLRMVEL